MKQLFPTMEVGSLKKPRWHTNAENRLPPKEEHLAVLRRQASLLLGIGAADLEVLLKDPAANMAEIIRWSSIFAIKMQEQAGLDVVWNGEMWRSEMYQDPIEKTGGMQFVSDYRGTHVWGGNYYKAAECVGPVRFTQPWHLEEFIHTKSIASRPVKVPLTDAHTLGEWSYDVYYAQKWEDAAASPRARKYGAKRDFILALARGPLRENIKQLVANGARIIQLDGPAAVTDVREYTGKRYDLPLFVEAFNEATQGIDCEFHSHICYPPEGGYELLFKYIMEMKKCKQFSMEFANRDSTALGVSVDSRQGYAPLSVFREYNDGSKVVGLGVLDVHTDVIESPDLVRDRLLRASKVLGNPESVVAVPDCGLRTRSLDVAYQKLCNLVEGARLARTAAT